MTPFAPALWLADGPDVTGAAGFVFPTRMAVMRLRSGALVVWSPVALTQGLRAAVDALGLVAHLIAPNRLHVTFLADWARAYPQATVHGAPGVAADGLSIAPLTDAPWGTEIGHVVIRTRLANEALFHHRESGTLLVCDLLQCMSPDRFTGWRGYVARLDGMVGDAPRVPAKFKLALRDRAQARRAVATVARWQADGLVIAHGTPLTSGGAKAFADAFAWL